MTTLAEVLDRVGVPADRADEVLASEPAWTPWYVRAAVGAGTWVGAFLVGLVLVLSDLASSQAGALVVGLGLVAAAGVASRTLRSLATGQLVLASSLGGQALLLIAIGRDLQADSVALVFAALQAIMILVARDTTHRFLSAASGLAALWFALTEFGVPTTPLLLLGLAASAGLLLEEARLLGTEGASLVRPVAYGLATGVLGLALLEAFPGDVLSRELQKPRTAIDRALFAAGLVAIGGWVARRAFREASHPLAGRGFTVALAGGLATAAFAFQVPALLVAFVLLVVAHARREYVLGGLACTFLAACYGVFYFELQLTLLEKSFALAGTGLVFFALSAALGAARTERGGGAIPIARRGAVLAGATILTLATVGGLALSRELIRRDGRPVLLELAPVDPRSLVQGDYLTLRYAIARDVEEALGDRTDGLAVLRLDERGVGALARLDDGTPLAPDEQRLRVRRRDGDVRLGAESFFIEEGSGDRWAGARFGELRVSSSGTALVTGLRDGDLRPLGDAARSSP